MLLGWWRRWKGMKVRSRHPQSKSYLIMLMVKKHLPPIREFSTLSILKMIYLHALFYLLPKPEFLFMHSLIHSVFNSCINIYRIVNYVLSIVQFAQDTALRHTNKQTDKQMDKKTAYLLWGNFTSMGRDTFKKINSTNQLVSYKTNVPAISLLGIYPREMETIFTQKSVCKVLVIIAKNRNQSKCPSTGMVKHMVVHPYHGILLGREKELLLHDS